MDSTLRIFLLAVITVLAIIILMLLKRGKLSLKYSLLWIISIFLMYIIVLIPNLVFSFAFSIGIIDPLNLVWAAQALFVILILLSITVIASGLRAHIVRLTQKVALLEKELDDMRQARQENGAEDERVE